MCVPPSYLLPFLHWRSPPSQPSQEKGMHIHPLAVPPPQLCMGWIISNGRAGSPARGLLVLPWWEPPNRFRAHSSIFTERDSTSHAHVLSVLHSHLYQASKKIKWAEILPHMSSAPAELGDWSRNNFCSPQNSLCGNAMWLKVWRFQTRRALAGACTNSSLQNYNFVQKKNCSFTMKNPDI